MKFSEGNAGRLVVTGANAFDVENLFYQFCAFLTPKEIYSHAFCF